MNRLKVLAATVVIFVLASIACYGQEKSPNPQPESTRAESPQIVALISGPVLPLNLELHLCPDETVGRGHLGEWVLFTITQNGCTMPPPPLSSKLVALIGTPATSEGRLPERVNLILNFLQLLPAGIELPDGWSINIGATVISVQGHDMRGNMVIDPGIDASISPKTEIIIRISSSNWQHTSR